MFIDFMILWTFRAAAQEQEINIHMFLPERRQLLEGPRV